MGISSLASGRSSRACALCRAFLLSAFRSCCLTEVSGVQRHRWPSSSPCRRLALQQWWHLATPTSLSCSPTLPCPPNRGKGFPGTSHPHAHINCLGKRNSLSQLGHLHSQGCQAPEDCNSQANIFPDIFCGCTIYSVVQSHEICRAFHGNHRDSFLLKETASNRIWNIYMDKINQFKDIRKPITTNSAPRNPALSPWEAGVGKNVWQMLVTVLDALWKKANWEQEEPSKNPFCLCLTSLCTSSPLPAEPVPILSPTPWGLLLKCIATYSHEKNVVCPCFTVAAQTPIQIGILTTILTGFRLFSPSLANRRWPPLLCISVRAQFFRKAQWPSLSCHCSTRTIYNGLCSALSLLLHIFTGTSFGKASFPFLGRGGNKHPWMILLTIICARYH